MGNCTYIESVGTIHADLRYRDGRVAALDFSNRMLAAGKKLVVGMLTGASPTDPVYISHMLFGDGGIDPQTKKKREVKPDQAGLFGVVRLKKPAIVQIDPQHPTHALFTTVLNLEDANDVVINEMALALSNGELFSLSTFSSDLTKTDQFEITWTWRVAY